MDQEVHKPLEIDQHDDTKEAPSLEQMDDIAKFECKLTDDEYHIRTLENTLSSELFIQHDDVEMPKSVKKTVRVAQCAKSLKVPTLS